VFPDNGVPPGAEADNSLPDPDVVAGCEELWYSTARCQPRFDPAQANAIIAEILNLIMCGNNVYDCNRLDNLCTAVIDLINDVIFGCLTRTFPSTAGACSVQYLALMTDAAGCTKIARYSQASSTIAWANEDTVFPDPTQINIPVDPTNPASYYNRTQLYNDIMAGTINEALLANTRVIDFVFNIVCDGAYEFEFDGNVVFDPAGFGGAGRSSMVTYRIDGVFPMIPSNVGGFAGSNFTNFEAQVKGVGAQYLTAGAHHLQIYVLGGGQQAAQLSCVHIGATVQTSVFVRNMVV